MKFVMRESYCLSYNYCSELAEHAGARHIGSRAPSEAPAHAGRLYARVDRRPRGRGRVGCARARRKGPARRRWKI